MAAGLNKDTAIFPHALDAAAIAVDGELPAFRTNVVMKKTCIPEGEFRQTRGLCSNQRIPAGKIGGFRKCDKVRWYSDAHFISVKK